VLLVGWSGGRGGHELRYAAFVGVVGLALAGSAYSYEGPSSEAAGAAECATARVQYGRNGFIRDPWVTAGRGAASIRGTLYSPYSATLGDARVREAAGLTLYAGRMYKIAWLPRTWPGQARYLVVEGRKTDGTGTFRQRFQRAFSPRFFPSGIVMPSAGCWRLTLRSGGRRWTLDVAAVEPPASPRCDTNPVESGRHPVDAFFTRWVSLTPRSSRISATFSVFVDGVEGAAMYAGGHWPGGANTKILWIVDNPPSGRIELRGLRLDGQGSFQQMESAAVSPAYAFPSIVVVPEPGCWLVHALNGSRGGVLVIRVLAA
jgi:hypothetical protein